MSQPVTGRSSSTTGGVSKRIERAQPGRAQQLVVGRTARVRVPLLVVFAEHLRGLDWSEGRSRGSTLLQDGHSCGPQCWPGWRRRCRRRPCRGDARVVEGQLPAAHVHGVLLAALADPFRGPLAAVGEHGAESLSLGDLLGQGDHGLGVSPGQLEPSRVPRSDQAVLVALDGERDGPAGRDGVDAVAVADLVRPDDGLSAVVLAESAQGGEGLVLGPVGLVLARVRPSSMRSSAPQRTGQVWQA